MNTEKIKREYENAVYLQSYTEMKKVAQKLLNLIDIEESPIYTKYTQYITFRGQEYQVDVEFDAEWNFRISDIENNTIDFGTIDGENATEIFEKIKNNFNFHIIK